MAVGMALEGLTAADLAYRVGSGDLTSAAFNVERGARHFASR